MCVDDRPTVAAPDDDPHLWLEEVEGERAADFVEQQNRRTLETFGGAQFAADRDLLAAIYDRPDNIPYVTRHGGFLYNLWKDPKNPRGLWRRTTIAEFRKAQPQWEVVLDVDKLAAEENQDWLLNWTQPLFENDTPEMVRIREASAFFSDLAWRRHPDDRATGAFAQVLNAPFAGASHRARALIAASVFHRYSGDEDFPQAVALAGLLDKDDDKRALVLGLTWRFAFSLSASAAGELAHHRLRMTPSKVILEVPTRREAIAGEPVQRRLGELADALGRKGEILVG